MHTIIDKYFIRKGVKCYGSNIILKYFNIKIYVKIIVKMDYKIIYFN
jgi:hypothetical protein